LISPDGKIRSGFERANNMIQKSSSRRIDGARISTLSTGAPGPKRILDTCRLLVDDGAPPDIALVAMRRIRDNLVRRHALVDEELKPLDREIVRLERQCRGHRLAPIRLSLLV
jgi:hypothetical protein